MDRVKRCEARRHRLPKRRARIRVCVEQSHVVCWLLAGTAAGGSRSSRTASRALTMTAAAAAVVVWLLGGEAREPVSLETAERRL